MAIHKRGRQSFVLPQLPVIDCWASVAGKKESEGPLADTFDITSQDTRFGQQTWEQAEKYMQQLALETLVQKAGLENREVDLVLSGDLEDVAKLYDYARAFMRAHGNLTQWPDYYPDMESAREDLENGVLYVAEHADTVVGTFVLMPGPDLTYGYIENGAWRSDTPYGAIHRVASRGGGVLRAALDFARGQYAHIRMDTHADNAPMRHLLTKAGFSHRGTIYVENGTARMAFDYLEEERHGESE